MRRIVLGFLICLLSFGFASAQESEQSPYEIALERIEEARVTGATELDLMALGLADLPPEIGTLVNLQTLELTYNQLSSLPSEIARLENLRELFVGGNQLSSLPPEIGTLRNLYFLQLSFNQLSSLPPEIGNLSQLRILSLPYNRLEAFPAEFGKLHQLEFLDLRGNQLHDLPSSLSQLSELGRYPFNCMVNGLFCGLYLEGNPLISPPQQIISQGTAAILEYLRNEAWWHLQRLILGGLSSVGLVVAFVLGMRWRQRQKWAKKKRQLN